MKPETEKFGFNRFSSANHSKELDFNAHYTVRCLCVAKKTKKKAPCDWHTN